MFAFERYGGSTAIYGSECQAGEQSRSSLPENAGESRNARHVISDYEDKCPSTILLTPSCGERVSSKLGSDQGSILFAVKGYLQLASLELYTMLIVWSDISWDAS
jgi:hypothetical protein